MQPETQTPRQPRYFLYFDDTGSRDPDRSAYLDASQTARKDGMDCFGLGGILIKEEDVEEVLSKHKAFCASWDIDYPLHSSRIRGGQGKFGWLKKPENAGAFFAAMEEYLLSLPIVCIACVIDRPGYVARYKDKYQDHTWYMCKTAFTVLVERAAKYCDNAGRQLEIFYEETGRVQDRDIVAYMRELKNLGCPFDQSNASGYLPLHGQDYKRIILGEPRRRTKKMPMIQIADLVLYPMAKGGYDPLYRPYKKLIEHKKLIDCFLEPDAVPNLGIKYSCFEGVRKN